MEAFKEMPLTELVVHWKYVLTVASHLLLRIDSGLDAEGASARLRQLVANTGFSCLNVALLNPDVMLRFCALDMEENALKDNMQM